MDSFCTSVAMRLEQVMYTPSIIMACCATDWRSKKRFRVENGGFVALPVVNPDRLSDRSAHLIRWSVQRTAKAWDQLANSVGICSMEELVQLFIFLGRPWGRIKVLIDERDEAFVSHDESALYSFEASTTRNCEESFTLLQGLPFNAIAALHAFVEDSLEEPCNAVLSSEL